MRGCARVRVHVHVSGLEARFGQCGGMTVSDRVADLGLRDMTVWGGGGAGGGEGRAASASMDGKEAPGGGPTHAHTHHQPLDTVVSPSRHPRVVQRLVYGKGWGGTQALQAGVEALGGEPRGRRDGQVVGVQVWTGRGGAQGEGMAGWAGEDPKRRGGTRT